MLVLTVQSLFILQADNEACLDRAFLLIDMHFRDLATQKSLLDRNEFVAQKVRVVFALYSSIQKCISRVRNKGESIECRVWPIG